MEIFNNLDKLYWLAAGGDLSGNAAMNVAEEVDELVALAQSLSLNALLVEAAVVRAGGSTEEACQVRYLGCQGNLLC